MASIKIEITIPDYEYKEWHDNESPIEEVMASLKGEIIEDLKKRYIRYFEIEIEQQD